MRRNTYWALSTLTVLVLVFGYRTSTSSSMAPTGNVSAHSTFSGSIPAAGAGSPGGDDPATAAARKKRRTAARKTVATAKPHATHHSPTSTPTARSSAASPTSRPHPSTSGSTSGSRSTPTRSSTPTPKPSPKPTPSPTPTPKPPASRTITGRSISTRFGPLQVQIKVTGSTITSVSVLQYPSSSSRDVQINNHALPILINETLNAQSANIDMVSGATYTSNGYIQSLQSALDQM